MKLSRFLLWMVPLLVAGGFAERSASSESKDAARPHLVAISPIEKLGGGPSDSLNALRSGSVELDLDALRELAALDVGSRPDILIEPFAGQAIELNGDTLTDNGKSTLVARLTHGESGVFILSWAGTNIYGMLEAGFTRYIFQSNREDPYGTLRVREIDQASFAGCGTGDTFEGASRWAPKSKPIPALKTQPANHDVVELMVLYTPAVRSNQGGDPSSFINTLEASMNAAIGGSSVTGAVRVVRYREISFTEPNPLAFTGFEAIRDDMKNSASPFTNIQSERANYRADLVVLLIDGNAVGQNGGDPPICGISKSLNGPDSTLANIVVSDSCAAGDLTFAHEVTHSLGGRHDWLLDTTTGWTPGTGHGYTNTTVDFRTVMGSRQSCSYAGGCARLSRFSDPGQTAVVGGTSYALGVTDDNGTLGGDQTPNVVSVLGNSIVSVAAYKDSGDAAPGQPSSLAVDRLCSGYNELTWPAPSGTTGWYEAQSSSSSTFTSTDEEYRGGQNSVIIHVSGTRWVRARACNAEGCGSYRNGSQTATTGCP